MLRSTVNDSALNTRLFGRQALPFFLGFAVFTLRVMALDRQSFWGDEGASVYQAEVPLDQTSTGAFSDQVPLYFWLLKGWILLAGDSEFAVRLFSVLCGVASVALIYLLAKRMLGQWVALLAMGLATVSPLFHWYAQEARPFALLVLLSLVMLLALLSASEHPKKIAPWGAYALAATMAVYTHISIVPVVALWPPLMLVMTQPRDDRPRLWRMLLSRGLLGMAAVGVVAAATIPWLVRGAHQMIQVQGFAAGMAKPLSLPTVLANNAIVFTLGNTVARVDVDLSKPANLADYQTALLLIAPVLLVAFRGFLGRPGHRRQGFILAALLLVPMLAMFFYASGRHDVHPRYFIAMSPIWVMLVAAGLAELWSHRLVFVLAGAAVLVASGFAMSNYYTNPRFQRDDWRAAVRYILAQERTGDAIIVDSPYTEPVVAYYHRGGVADIYSLPFKHPPDPEAICALLSQVSASHKTVWLLFWQDFYYDPQHVAATYLDVYGSLMSEHYYRGASLFRRYSTSPLLMKPDFNPSHPMSADLGNQVRLIGYDLDESEVATKSQLYVTLYWEAMQPIEADLRVFVHLVNSAYTAWGNADGQPGYFRFPTSRWPPGQIVRDEYAVPVLPGTPPGEYLLDVGMYDPTTGRRLGEHGEGDHLVLGPVTIVSQEAQAKPSKSADVTFGDDIELVGYDVQPVVRPGDTLPVTLYWRADGPINQDYMVFVHVTDDTERPLAQRDNQPADGNYPTSRWESGRISRDQYSVSLPTDLPPGEYQVRVGLYNPATGERLPAWGNPSEKNYFEIGSVRVAH